MIEPCDFCGRELYDAPNLKLQRAEWEHARAIGFEEGFAAAVFLLLDSAEKRRINLVEMNKLRRGKGLIKNS